MVARRPERDWLRHNERVNDPDPLVETEATPISLPLSPAEAELVDAALKFLLGGLDSEDQSADIEMVKWLRERLTALRTQGEPR